MSDYFKTIIDCRLPDGNPEKVKVEPLTEDDYAAINDRISETAAKKIDPKFYVENRTNEYPSIGDQIDALMKYLSTKDDIPDELRNIINKRQSIKQKYPKGN